MKKFIWFLTVSTYQLCSKLLKLTKGDSIHGKNSSIYVWVGTSKSVKLMVSIFGVDFTYFSKSSPRCMPVSKEERHTI